MEGFLSQPNDSIMNFNDPVYQVSTIFLSDSEG